MKDADGADFGRLAVALGFLTREDVDKALRLQDDLRRVGVERRLGELMLEKKILTRDQVLLVLRAQGKRILTCQACKKSYNVHHYRPDRMYACKHCKEPLQVPQRAADTRVNGSIVIDARTLRPVHAAPRKPPVARNIVYLLPGYEIVERLGQGGMGAVYKARDTIMGRWVAVKLLAPFLATDEEYVKRFFIEAKNLRRLRHPNIVEAYDAGVAGDHKFFIMEFVDGVSLDKALEKKGKLTERKALEIARQVAGALDYAWQHRIIHRDVKPQNVMVTHDRTVKLCDLGLSKDVESQTMVTMTGSINCSPPYVSPEQAQGLKNLDCRTDTYSLGVMLFQLVTGELPFKGESPGDFIIQHVTKPPPHPISKNPNLTSKTALMILRMLEKDPEKRPEPGEVEQKLSKFLGHTTAAVR